MVEGRRIGILYNYDEHWIGGAYYIQNLIRSLNSLPKEEQIVLNILAKDEFVFENLKKTTGYEKLKFIQFEPRFSILERVINKLTFKVFRKKIISKKPKLDYVFPIFGLLEELKHISNIIFWIPDLQDKHLPDFFSEEEIQARHNSFLNMIALGYPIVFSSYSALNDFRKFFPVAKNRLEVLQFAVVHPPLEFDGFEDVKLKYSIEGDYFISPNQFWQHKNHMAIIQAARILKSRGVKVKIVFTGKEYDYRNPDYTSNLKQKVFDYQLENEVLFLGFIDRADQLMLMKNALAVIQPSLFEGWSTVVEDAKALNQTLIVSNIQVHIEQLVDKAYFFEPHDYQQLANQMLVVLGDPINKLRFDLDYSLNIKKFANKLKYLITNN